MNRFCPVLFDLIVKRITAVRGSQNGTAPRQDSCDRLDRQQNGALRPDQPVEAVIDAYNSPAVPEDSGPNSAANDGIEPRTISAPVGDADRLNRGRHASSVLRQATGPEAQEDILHHPLSGFAEDDRLLEDQPEQLKSRMATPGLKISGGPKSTPFW